jgi:O-antigen/teichoic acid export membrane protein
MNERHLGHSLMRSHREYMPLIEYFLDSPVVKNRSLQWLNLAARTFYGYRVGILYVFSPSRFFSQIMGVGPVKRHSFISFISNVGVTGIGYIATMYIAHTIGAAPLGVFFLFLAYWNVLNLIADGGTGGAAIQRISEGHDQSQYFSAQISLRVIFLIATLLILFLAGVWNVAPDLQGILILLGFAVVISSVAGVYSTGVYGSGKVGVSQVAELVNVIVKVAFQIGAVYLGFSAGGIIGGAIAGVAAGAVVNARFLDLHLQRFRWDHIRSLLSYSSWTFLTGATAVILGYADAILVGFFLDTTEVGLYRIALQFSTIAAFFALSLRSTLYPKISRWNREGDMGPVETSLSRALTYSLFLAVPVLFGGGLLAEPIMYYLYGSSFTPATPALVILLGSQIIMVFVTLETMSLGALNHPREVFRCAAAASIILVGLDALLIPRLGITGAAVAFLCSMGVNALIAHWFLRRLIIIRVEKKPISRIILASFIMAIVVAGFRILIPFTEFIILLLVTIFGALIYFILILKWDRGICDELKEFAGDLGLPWPSWL